MQKELILSRIIDQQKEVEALFIEQQIVHRVQSEFLKKMLPSKLVKVVMGIRRSGKSTLVLQAMQNKKFVYFNFDDEILSQLSASDLNDLYTHGLALKPDAEFFIFDEIQNIEKWEHFINRLQRKKVNVVLTGSNSRLLSSELSTHLTGRQVNLELFPFSFSEYLKFHGVFHSEIDKLTTTEKSALERRLQSYMHQGSFPEILVLPEDSSLGKTYLKELYDKILSRDIVQRRKIKHVKAFREIGLLLFSQYASQFTFQSLKKASSINSINTVKNYVEYIQESYLGFVVDPFSHKVKERISLPKKFYSIDTAIVDAVIGRSTRDQGKKLENLVFVELRRRGQEIYYVKEATYEVDFLVREGLKLSSLIQVCWSMEDEFTRKREIQSLLKAAEKYKIKDLKIITAREEEIIKLGKSTIHVLPVWKWLLQ